MLGGLGGRSDFVCGRSLGRGADGGFTDKNGTCLDGEGLGLDVADDLSAGFQFDPLGGG